MKTRDHCKTLAEKNAHAAGLGMMFPVPGLTAIVTVVEVKLVQEIARAYGEELSGAEAAKWIALSGVKNYGVKLAAEALIFVPFFGWFARPILTQWSAERLAERAIAHFEGRHPDAEYTPPAPPAPAPASPPPGSAAPAGACA